MEKCNLGCEVCLTKNNTLHGLKSHFHTWAHQEKFKEIFQEDVFRGPDFFPYIVFLDRKAKRDIKHPIVGLSLLTLCFSRETQTFFYLCHVCENKRPPDMIFCHLYSHDHYSNYFNYKDPNVLSFSWMPSMDVKVTLRPQLTKEVNENGSGTLQLLALPGNLMKKFDTSTYSEVMHTLSENDKLLKVFEATKPERVMIQTYQTDSTRKHPLLGMQHLVECICVGLTEKRYYLCTLCKITLGNHMIIKHVLSFDHIFCYFKAWHPSTLLAKESYKGYTKSFESMMLDFAKQTEEIHGTADTDMKQVSLEPAEFTSVNFSCYTEALAKLESITKEKKGISLIPNIKPGNQLKCHPVSAVSVSSYKLCCQDCRIVFETISQYLRHLSERKHKQMLTIFLSNAEGYYQKGWKPTLGLYSYLRESMKRNQPVIGLSPVVACVSTQFQAEPFYVCFACQDCVSESFIMQHFKSQKHLIHTLLYQNPWRLPFAWENHLDVNMVRSQAWEEERERGQDQMILKVLDIPYQTFQRLITPSFQKVMDKLQQQHTLFTHLMYKVPQCQTHKLKENERFPLLGKQFLVMHDVCDTKHQSTEVGFLCLLCRRRLSDGECYAHVFSREHVATFLDRFHPGSQSSSTDAETLLDLAKQAARSHSVSNLQVIKLDKPIWEPCTYQKAISIVASAKRRQGGGALEPRITPLGKLVPRDTVKEEGKDNTRDNRSTDNNTATKMSVEVGSETINTCFVKGKENSKKGADKEAPTPSDKESERREALSKTRPDEVAGSETGQLIKEEQNIEEPTGREPSGQMPQSCQNTDKSDGAETGQDMSQSSKDVLTQLKIYMGKENERKRSNSMSEKSQEDTCSDEDAGRGMGRKKQRLTSKEDASCEEIQKMPSGGLKDVTTTDKGEFGTPSHTTAEDKAFCNKTHQQAARLWQYVKKESREPVIGLSALIECHCDQHDPIYLCECCFLMIQEKNIISHVTGYDHQKAYFELKNLQGPSRKQRRKKMSVMAAQFEKQRGYGKAQVVELDEEIYEYISKQTFYSAIQIVTKLQAQQNSGCELPSTTALPGVQPVHASVIVQAQQEAGAVKDNIQVVENAPSATVLPLETVTTPKIVGTSQTAAISYSTTTSSATAATTKSIATITTCTATPSKHTAASYKSTTTTSTSSVTVSNTTSTVKSATVSKPLESGTRAGSRITATSCKATSTSQTGSPVLCESTRRTTPSQTASNVTVTSQTTVTSASAPPVAKMSVKSENTEASPKTVHMKNANADVVPHKSHPPAAPHPTTAMSVRSEHRNPPAEPSDTPTTKTKPSARPRVGLNQLIIVLCEQRQQVYCRLCSVRLTDSSHLYHSSHQFNHVKMTYPGWTAKLSKNKLDKIVTLMAEVEKNVGSRGQTLEVKKDVYDELGDLPEDKALERLKAMLTERDLQVSSTTDTAKALTQHVAFASPCEVSDDEMPQDEPPGLSTNNQPEQENQHELQKPLVCMPEMMSNLEEEADQSDGAWSWTDKGPEAHDLTPNQFLSCLRMKNDPDPIPAPSIQDGDIAVTIKQERFEPDVQSQAHVEVTPAIQSPAVEEPHGCTVPLATDSESAGTYSQPPHACQETPENTQQQERSNPEIQGKEKSPVISFSPDILASAAMVNTEQENQSKSSLKAEHVLKRCSPGPGQQSASQAFPSIVIGAVTQGCSHLSTFLRVKGLDTQPIIGLGSVWECRGTPSLDSFFLCESCEEMLFIRDICQHIISPDHQYKYLMRHYPQFLWFWTKEDVLQQGKLDILKDVALLISVRERAIKMDAQCVLLSKELYETVQNSPFSKAIEIVQNIKEHRHLRGPISTQQQGDKQPEKQQNRQESPPMEALETDQRSHNGARQKTEKHHLEEETAVAGGLDGVKRRTALSCLDVPRVSLKADSVVSPFPDAGACLSPQETCGSLRPPVSQLLKPIAEVQVKQTVEHSESQSVCTVSPKTAQTPSVSPRDKCLPTRERSADTPVETTLVQSCTSNPQLEDPLPAKYMRSSLQQQCQPSPEPAPESTSVKPAATSTPPTQDVLSESQSICTVGLKTAQTPSVSPRDKCLPTRKRSADTPVETLVTSFTNNPQLEDPLPAKCTRSTLQQQCQPSPEPASESTSVKPAATSTPLSQKDEDTGPGSDQQDASILDQPPYSDLIALVKARRSEVNVSSCILAPDNAETTTSANNSAKNGVQTRLDSNFLQTKWNIEKPKTKWDSKHRLVEATAKNNPPSTASANSSSLQNNSADDNLLFGAPEATTVSTTLPSASVNAENTFGNVATNHNTGQISQPQDNTQTDTSGVSYLPVLPIITPRPDPTREQFMGGYKGRDHAKVNTGSHVAHSFSTVDTAYPSNTLAAPGAYSQCSQMAYATNEHLGHLSSHTVGGYTVPQNPPVYTGSLSQQQGHTASGYYPSQIYPGQEAAWFNLQSFGNSSAAPVPPGLVSMQHQLQQQQYASWTTATSATGDGNVTSDAASFGAVSFPPPANNSQGLIHLNQYVPRQYSNNITQNTSQVYLGPQYFYCYYPANSEDQPSANYFFVSGTGACNAGPSGVSAMPPTSR